jgi:hypothetical protein
LLIGNGESFAILVEMFKTAAYVSSESSDLCDLVLIRQVSYVRLLLLGFLLEPRVSLICLSLDFLLLVCSKQIIPSQYIVAGSDEIMSCKYGIRHTPLKQVENFTFYFPILLKI